MPGWTRGLAALWMALGLAAGARAEPGQPLLVFAAASLQESLDQLAADWTARSGRRVQVSYAGSAALARQIEQGAPADIFLSADRAWMDYLQERGLVAPDTRFDLAGNELVVVAPATDPAPLDLGQPGAVATRLGGDGRLSVAEVATVPAGRYARQALQATGHWPQLADRLAQSDNVRAALLFVARGEAPLGIVYATDARPEPRVVVVARFAPGSHPRIVYPAARVAASSDPGADAFLAWLRGPEARATLRRFGFGEP